MLAATSKIEADLRRTDKIAIGVGFVLAGIVIAILPATFVIFNGAIFSRCIWSRDFVKAVDAAVSGGEEAMGPQPLRPRLPAKP